VASPSGGKKSNYFLLGSQDESASLYYLGKENFIERSLELRTSLIDTRFQQILGVARNFCYHRNELVE
jgi:hypothetical protein